ncbi:MAG TPA: tetratricopeptide repeat protein, partial [Bacteroidales bacterium]|nr:tetratricopeptide repeat protein [Bacteroidales bacterium]
MTYRLRTVILTVILLTSGTFYGQAPQHSGDDLFARAVELFRQEQYWSAYELFNRPETDDMPGKESLVASYRLLCEIAMEDRAIADRVSWWEQKHPSAPLKNLVYFKLGNLYASGNLFKEAITCYDKVKVRRLPEKERASYTFRKGYATMQRGDTEQAVALFLEAENYPVGESYKWASRYYRGYIHYAEGRFEEAVPLLEPLMEVPQYASLSTAYLLQSLLYLKQYGQVIKKGVPIYQQSDKALRTTLAKTLSEAYFALDRTVEARSFFDDYLKDISNLTLTDRYFSGILYFKLGDYVQAAEQLSIVGERQDSLGQNALYHLGESYIRLRNKVDALVSFKRASVMPYDPDIREDAFYNYAKLSFDLNGDIQVLSSYRKEYPDSPKLDEIQTYIAANFFMNQDYASAVEALQALKNPTAENSRDLKKAAFLRGIQLYQTGSFRDAEKYFSLAQEPYWIAECLYRDNKFNNAINIWRQFIKESGSFSNPEKYRTSHYNIGYAYFKMRDYPNAADWFNRYLRLGVSNRSLVADTYLRLGDCAFAQYKHQEAAGEYQRALDYNTAAPDYALFQIAMAQGVLNLEAEKIITLDRLMQEYPTSPFFSSALFEQGRTYVQTNQYEKAEERFNTILSFDSHRAIHAKALVELGLIRINMQNPDAALDYYKEVLRRYPDSPDAANALAGIENVYMSRNDSEGFFNYLESLGIDSGKSPDEKEIMAFTSAEQLFLNNSPAAAVTALNKFIGKYPKSVKIPAAYFYLG